MNRVYSNKTQGFTLVELLVVMLVLVALSSITLDFTQDFAFQGRYEVTKDRYDKIKRAIIGRPDVLINGQPDISGFVADMGRLPRNIQELLVQNYCMPDYKISDNTVDGRPVAYMTNKAWCIGAYPSATVQWVEQTAWVAPAANSLSYGWRGPYITSQNADYEANAFSDGWGSIATADTDHNYGWNIVHRDNSGTNIVTIDANLADIADATQLVIQSYGKNAVAGGSNYDVDYPEMQPVIKTSDWLFDISKLNVDVKTPSPFSSGNYCEITNLSLKNACLAASQLWSQDSFCHDTSKIEATCTTSPFVWRMGHTACEDTSKVESTCVALPLSWASISSCSSIDISTCNANWMEWDGSKCLSKSKEFCENYISPEDIPEPNLCVSANYHALDSNGNTVINQPLISNQVTVVEDGLNHQVNLSTFYNDSNNNGIKGAGEIFFIDLPAGNIDLKVNLLKSSTAECTAINYPSSICVDKNNSTSSFTELNCDAAGGVWLDSGTEKYCYGLSLGSACTGTGSGDLNGVYNYSSAICANTNNHANFSVTNCSSAGGTWVNDGNEQYCNNISSADECTGTTSTNLGGTFVSKKQNLNLLINAKSPLLKINW